MKKYILILTLTFAIPVDATAKGKETQGGRFQLIQLSDMRRDQYLLDTQTGNLWQPKCTKLNTDGVGCSGTTIFEKVPVQDVNVTNKDIERISQLDAKIE